MKIGHLEFDLMPDGSLKVRKHWHKDEHSVEWTHTLSKAERFKLVEFLNPPPPVEQKPEEEKPAPKSRKKAE